MCVRRKQKTTKKQAEEEYANVENSSPKKRILQLINIQATHTRQNTKQHKIGA